MIRCYHASVVFDVPRSWFVAALLMLCVGVHALELSGRWDRTFEDANDEAGVIAIVLCIGVAVAIGRRLLNAIPLTRLATAFIVAITPVASLLVLATLVISTSAADPPLALRV